MWVLEGHRLYYLLGLRVKSISLYETIEKQQAYEMSMKKFNKPCENILMHKNSILF